MRAESTAALKRYSASGTSLLLKDLVATRADEAALRGLNEIVGSPKTGVVVMSSEHPISYLALAVGTPVESSTGRSFGTVEHVLQIPELDLFDGLVVTTESGLRFIARDQILEITTSTVHCALADDEVAQLLPPEGTPTFGVDALQDVGPALTARLGRMFGRAHWIEKR